MPGFELSQVAQHWVNVVLLWVGFGTLAGLLAQVLVPGREPAGAVGTVVIGILGSTIGPLLLSHLVGKSRFNPISPLGFLFAIGAAFALLVGYRLLLATFRPLQPDDPDEEDDEP